MVSGISASAIGSNYCGANAVSATSVPGMTDEEVAWMDSRAEYWSIIQKLWYRYELSDESAYNLLMDLSNVRADWDKNFYKKESWRRAEATKKQLLKEFNSNPEKSQLLGDWIGKILYGDNKMSSAFG